VKIWKEKHNFLLKGFLIKSGREETEELAAKENKDN
jgi:hypothetical protein